MDKVLLTLFAITLGLFGTLLDIQEQDQIEKSKSRFMLRKLDYSRDIVAGLATENYEQIAKAAQDLMVLSHEADWKVITTPDYLKASSDFRDTVLRLREAGRQKNLDGATLAYFEVTLNCIRCHKQIRQKPALKPLNKPERPN